MNKTTTYQISTVVLILVVVFLAWKSCNTKSDTDLPPTPDFTGMKDSVQHIVDSVNKRADKNLDSSGNVNKLLTEFIQDLNTKQKDAESSATFWAMKYRLAKRDSNIAVITESCDSVIGINSQLMGLNEKLRNEWAAKDANYQYQLRVADTLRGDMDLAYNSVVDLVVQSNETLDKYKQATRPRASLYIGITGGTNFTQASAGPSLMYRGKGGKTMLGASYEVGNDKPFYRAGIYKRISFRK